MRIRRALLIATALCSVALSGTAWSAAIYYRVPSSAPNPTQPTPVEGGGTVGAPTMPTSPTTPTAPTAPATPTTPPDTTPDAFSIPELSGQAPGSTVTSSAVTVSGIDAATPIAVGGDASAVISVAGGSFGASGTISNGQSFTVRMTTPAGTAAAQTQTATVTVGGVSAAWSVETRALDTTPNAFSIAAVSGQAPGSAVTSAAVPITGIETAVPIAVSGDPSAQISVAGGAYTTAATISNGQSFTVRVMTPAATAAAQTQSITVTAGGVSATWTVGTRATDTAPDAFTIAAITGVAANTAGTSAAVTPTGYTDAAPISISGDASARISVAGGGYAASATISPGQSFTAQMTAGVADGSTKTATVTVGGVSSTWTMKVQDQLPDAFNVAALTGQTAGSTATSAAVTPAGYDTPATISVAGDGGPGLDINGDGNFQSSRTIAPGQSFRVRMTNAATGGATSNATVIMSGVSATFSATTVTAAPASASCPGTRTYVGLGNTTIGGTSGMPGGDVVGDGGWVVFYGVDASGNVQCIPNTCPSFTFTSNGGAQFTARYSVGNCGGTGYAPIARVYQRNGQTCYSNGGFEMCDGNAPALRGDWR